MDDITNSQDDNLGGLILIKFAPVRFFKSIIPVVFNVGCDWINLVCTSETMLYDEEFIQDANGGYHNVNISGAIPKIRPEVNSIISKYKSQQHIVLTNDMNGKQRIAGELGSGLELNYKSTSGRATSDLNGYGFEFSGQQPEPPLFL